MSVLLSEWNDTRLRCSELPRCPFMIFGIIRAVHSTWINTSDDKIGKVMIQLDAAHMNFIQRPLFQHVSGINMPIIRRTM
jgi:hypothetical protein